MLQTVKVTTMMPRRKASCYRRAAVLVFLFRKTFPCLVATSAASAFSNSHTPLHPQSFFIEEDKPSHGAFCIAESPSDAQGGDELYNLQSPRRWLEYCEAIDGIHGAYTVMRCDYSPASEEWKLWGKAFHLGRLVKSIRCMEIFAKDFVMQATKTSENAIDHILNAALASFSTGTKILEDEVLTVMLTVLWTPMDGAIKVRAHTFTTGRTLKLSEYNPSASVKVAQSERGANKDLPNRFEHHPEAKLSSWCRIRLPLEQAFKGSDIAEVLLARQLDNFDTELLEGLTSNLFVVHQDGTLVTSPVEGSVLGGYGRDLVLKHARKCGIRTREAMIKISEASEWREVFTTSAIKLIIPVDQVIVSDGTLWCYKDIAGNEELVWKRIFSSVITDGALC